MKRTIIILIIIVAIVMAVIIIVNIFSMKGDYTTLNANDFEKAIMDDNKPIIVDVRTADEYNAGHIRNAINIDVKGDNFLEIAEEKLEKGKKIAVYCQGGIRSRKAAAKLSSEGFSVINLEGGISEWIKAGKETVK